MKRLRCCCGLSVVVHAGLGFVGSMDDEAQRRKQIIIIIIKCCNIKKRGKLVAPAFGRIIIENLAVDLFGLKCNAQHWSEADKAF